jgi:hypothetical protein
METPLPTPEPQPETPPPAQMSLAGRLMNIFAAPMEVFDSIRNVAPATANWLVPALILTVVSWTTSIIILSQEPVKHQMIEIAERPIQQQVDAHRKSEQEAERERAAIEKLVPIYAKAAAVVVAPAIAFGGPFVWGLILWLVGKMGLKASFPYLKAVEVVGLGNMILVLDTVIRTLLIVALGSLYASPGPVLMIKDFDPQNTVHALLALANVLTFWLLGVRAAGLARLTDASFGKAALWVCGVWVTYNGFFIGAGLLVSAVIKRITGA